jgi:hypothetical protein
MQKLDRNENVGLPETRKPAERKENRADSTTAGQVYPVSVDANSGAPGRLWFAIKELPCCTEEWGFSAVRMKTFAFKSTPSRLSTIFIYYSH